MVGKLSDDRLMSGSRIPVLYSWLIAGEEHPYSTPNDELRRSIAAKTSGYERYELQSEPAYCGNMFEETIARDVCDVLELGEPELSPSVFTSQDGSWQCSMDALVQVPQPIIVFASDTVEIDGDLSSIAIDGPIPIEVKTTEAPFNGRTPLYRGPVQLQMQMMAVDAKFGIVATVHRGNFRHYKVYRCDPQMQQAIGDLCLDFRDRVKSETFYRPVNVEDCSKTHSGGNPDPVELHSLSDDVERLVELRQNAKSIEGEIEQLQTKIMSEMQDNEVAQVGTFVVKWPVRHYKPQPEKVTPAKEGRTVRLKTLQIKT